MSAGVIVGAHPWVYASRREGYDIFPILGQVIEDVAAAGFEGLELMHTVLRHEHAVEVIGDLSRRHSLPIIGSSFGGPLWDAAQRQAVLDAAAVVVQGVQRLGGRTLGVSTGKAPARKTPEQLDHQAEVLCEVDRMCAAAGLTMNLHNHTYEVEDGEYEVSETLRRFPEARLGPDLDWLTRAGIDPCDFLRRHGDRVVFLHLRDNRDGRWVESVGEGEMDFTGIRTVLDEIGFSGPAVVELAWESGFEPTRPLRESLRLSREHIRRTMGW